MAAPPKHFRWSWRSAAFRGLVYQIVAVLLVVAAGWYLVHNTLLNMRVRGIQSGFDFLQQPAGFAISESLWEFDSARVLRQGVPDRAVEHAARGDRRHRAGDDPGHAGRHRAAVAQLPRALALHRVRRAVPQRAAAAAAVHLVLHPDRVPAADRRGAAAAAERLLQQERPAVSDPAVGDGPRLAGGRACSVGIVGVLALGEVRAAPARGHGAGAAGVPARAGASSSSAAFAGLARRAARRRRSTSRRRRRSPWSAAAR